LDEKENFERLSDKLESNIQVVNQKILEDDIVIDKGYDKTTYFVKTEEGKLMKVKNKDNVKEKIERPNRNIKPIVHTNDEIKVLWGIDGNIENKFGVFGGFIKVSIIESGEEQWMKKMEDVEKYINDNAKRPSSKDKNKNISKLGIWIQTQKQNYYKNNSLMKNKKIKKIWENFITKYQQYFLSNEDEWRNTLQTISEYIDKNNRLPSKQDKNTIIKKMGSWLANQQKNYKKKSDIMKNEKIQKEWDKFIIKYQKYFVSNEEKWMSILQCVSKYIDENNNRPSSKDKNKNIAKLGIWIQTQNQIYTKKEQIMSNECIKKEWENFIKKYQQYFLSNEDEWINMLHSVSKYIDENVKRPSETDKCKNIKKMGYWLSNQQKNYANNAYIMTNEAVKKKWEDFIVKYQKYFVSNEDVWIEMLKSVSKYIDENNKRPSCSDKNIDIKKMGSWLSRQQNMYTNNSFIMKNEKIRKEWEDFMQKYKKYFISNEDAWIAMLESVSNYIDKNNKCPSSINKNTDIKKMGIWIQIQKKNYAKKIEIMKRENIHQEWEKFIAKYQQYFLSNEDEWLNMLQSVSKYIDENHIRPSSKDNNTNIKKMGMWLSHQQNNYSKKEQIMKNEKIRKEYDNFVQKYIKYFISNEEEWANILQDVTKYMNKNKKRPSCTDKNQNIKKMGTWIITQQQNYSKKEQIMKKENIQKQWEDFVTEYQEYFPDNPAIQKEEKTIKKVVKKSTTIEPTKENKEKESDELKRKRKQSEYQELTKKMSTQKSSNTEKMFNKNKDLWHLYHDERDFSFKGYDKQDEIPVNKIISYLETKKNHKLKILDLGCGRNQIYEHFKDNKKFDITGYDYVSYNNSKVSNISDLPEEDESVKICVYSQSLMGSDWEDYLDEGYRVLEYNGEMIISESVERYEKVKLYLQEINMHIIKEDYNETNRWFYIYAIKQ
jgi:antitoxin component HigA of HigAB toxin-antitoxin module